MQYCLHSSRIGLALCCLMVLSAIVEGGQQAAPKLPTRALRCPLSVNKMVDYAPEESIAAVKKACKPSGNNGFCEACICTVFANFMPATLQSAGVLTKNTPEDAADEAIGSCAPSSHVALMRLGALREEWSAALNKQCDSVAPLEGACDAYAPKKLPVKRSAGPAVPPAVTARVSKCPFQQEDVKAEELSLARDACGAGNTTDSKFCTSCLCAVQSTVDGIIKRRKMLLDSNSSAPDGDYKGCYIILTQALVEGDVLTPDAASVLGSDDCRPFAQLSSKERRAACSPEGKDVEGSAAGKAAAERSNATAAAASTGTTPGSQKSSGSVSRFGGAHSTVVVLFSTLVVLLAAGVLP